MSRLHRSLKSLACICITGVWAGCGDPAELEPPHFREGELSAAEVCGTCHVDIYRFWATSRHAAAAGSESFQTALDALADDAAAPCLGCHAPAFRLTGIPDPGHPLNREGVTCDVCHSTVDVHLDRPSDPLVLEVGPVKRGPVRDASSSGHGVAYSELHSESRFCAACHEFESDTGLAVLATYSEWLEYQAGGGTQTCQDCHMPRVSAHLIDPKFARAESSLISSHQMPGGSSPEQLRQAVDLEILNPELTGAGLQVVVRVGNRGAGHRFPTGLADRRVVLRLEFRAGESDWFEERSYQRKVVDGTGLPVREIARMFTDAVRVESDTRLAPGEIRSEEFLIPVPGAQEYRLTASLRYPRTEEPGTAPREPFLSVTRSAGIGTPP